MGRKVSIKRALNLVRLVTCLLWQNPDKECGFIFHLSTGGIQHVLVERRCGTFPLEGYSMPWWEGTVAAVRGSWSLHPQPGSRETWMPVFSFLSPFNSVQDPSPWDSAVLFWSTSSQLNQYSLEAPAQPWPGVCLLSYSRACQADIINCHNSKLQTTIVCLVNSELSIETTGFINRICLTPWPWIDKNFLLIIRTITVKIRFAIAHG